MGRKFISHAQWHYVRNSFWTLSYSHFSFFFFVISFNHKLSRIHFFHSVLLFLSSFFILLLHHPINHFSTTSSQHFAHRRWGKKRKNSTFLSLLWVLLRSSEVGSVGKRKTKWIAGGMKNSPRCWHEGTAGISKSFSFLFSLAPLKLYRRSQISHSHGCIHMLKVRAKNIVF